MDALTRVELTGSPSMTVYKSGVPVTFRLCTRGERLRLKVALAVALLHTARESGIGRHPGLLLVDSPGSEESAEDNVEAMIRALAEAAEAVDGIQIIVATRSVAVLNEVLGESRSRIADGDGYLW
jgi:hypothetical protein